MRTGMIADQAQVGVPSVGVGIGDEVLLSEPQQSEVATHLAVEVGMPGQDDFGHARHLNVERRIELEIFDERVSVGL